MRTTRCTKSALILASRTTLAHVTSPQRERRRGLVEGRGLGLRLAPRCAAWTGLALTVVAWAGCSAPEDRESPAEGTNASAVSAPWNLTAVACSSEIALSWTSAGGADGYNVWRGDNNWSHWIQIGRTSSTGWRDKTVVSGTTYSYGIRAYSSGTISASSNIILVTATGRDCAPGGLDAGSNTSSDARSDTGSDTGSDAGSDTGSDAIPICTPTTCGAQGKNCGSIADGCGHTLTCGTCSNGDTCGGGATPNVCGRSASGYSLGALDVPTLFDATDGSKDYLHGSIPTNPVLDPNNAAIIANTNIAGTPPKAGGPDWIIPIYRTSNADPAYSPPFTHAGDWGCALSGPMHIPNFACRETPDAVVGGDAWVVTVNTDSSEVSGIWQASKSNSAWSGSCGGTFALHGNGFQAQAGVGAGAGAQMGAGIILQSELLSGKINHALYSAAVASCSAFREPARKSDGHGSGLTCLPMGGRLQLDPAVNCDALSGASRGEIIICHALQTYGVYVLDSGGSGPLSGFSIQGDDLNDPNRVPWTTPGNPFRGAAGCTPSSTCGVGASVGLVGGAQTLRAIPWQRLRLLRQWNGN